MGIKSIIIIIIYNYYNLLNKINQLLHNHSSKSCILYYILSKKRNATCEKI